MDNKSGEKFIIMKYANESNKKEMKYNKQYSDEKTMNITEDFKEMIVSSITSTTDQINMLKSSPDQKDSPKPPDPTTVVLDKRRAQPLDGGYSTKNSGMQTLKYDMISPKLYELLIKTELKVYTALDLKSF